MKRRRRLRRRKPLKAKGGSRFPKRRDEAYLGHILTLPCVLTDRQSPCFGYTEAAHVRSRGAGGPDLNNLVPLCVKHHYWQHRKGIKTFEADYGIDLAKEAERLTREYQETFASD